MVRTTFALGNEPPLGNYRVELTVGMGNAQTTFRRTLLVEEFEKPEYSVTVTAPTDYGIAGDEIPITVEAHYFFGQPTAGADVTLTMQRQVYYWYDYWWESGPSPNVGGETQTYAGVTDKDGRWTVRVKPQSDADYTSTYIFTAEVTDARDRPVAGSTSLPVHWNTIKLNASTARYGYDVGDAVDVDLTALSHEGAPVGSKTLTVALERDYYGRDDDIFVQQEVVTDGTGTARATFTNLQQGWYRIRATTTDDRGRTVTVRRYIWVIDRASNSWWYFANNDISISADRDSYAVGDTAQLMIQSRITGTAMLTLEREDVREEIVVPLDGPVTAVDVPITADLSPNVFARVHIFKKTAPDAAAHETGEGYLVAAQTELRIPPTNKQLTIDVTTDAAEYLPGTSSQMTLKVTDELSRPVNARITVAVVDEALLALAR